MSQDNPSSQPNFQKSILSEMGMACWQLADTTLLAPDVASALSVNGALANKQTAENQADPKGQVVDKPISKAESKSVNSSAKDVLQQLSAQLGDKKVATIEAKSEPAPELVEAAQEVNDVLLYQLQGKLAQDIELVLQSIGRSYVTQPLEGKVCYPLVVSDDVAVRDSTSHYFSSQSLNQPQVKKRLWQLLQQS